MFKVRVKIGDKEVEVSYPIAERSSMSYEKGFVIFEAVKAVKEIVEILKSEK
jgi:hypothetical protein